MDLLAGYMFILGLKSGDILHGSSLLMVNVHCQWTLVKKTGLIDFSTPSYSVWLMGVNAETAALSTILNSILLNSFFAGFFKFR